MCFIYSDTTIFANFIVGTLCEISFTQYEDINVMFPQFIRRESVFFEKTFLFIRFPTLLPLLLSFVSSSSKLLTTPNQLLWFLFQNTMIRFERIFVRNVIGYKRILIFCLADLTFRASFWINRSVDTSNLRRLLFLFIVLTFILFLGKLLHCVTYNVYLSIGTKSIFQLDRLAWKYWYICSFRDRLRECIFITQTTTLYRPVRRLLLLHLLFGVTIAILRHCTPTFVTLYYHRGLCVFVFT